MEAKANFAESLKDLLTNKDINEVAGNLGISASTFYSWLRSESEPKRNYLILLADYFECSIEYLIGRSLDNRKVNNIICHKFSQILREVMKDAKISSYKLRYTHKFGSGHFYIEVRSLLYQH